MCGGTYAEGSTNHKPEIAVCLSDRFLGFAGLRPVSQSRALISSTPEIQSLPENVVKAVKTYTDSKDGTIQTKESDWEKLRNVFEAFISMEGDQVSSAVDTFVERVRKEGQEAFGIKGEIEQDDKARLVEATKLLDEYYPGDGSMFTSL